LLFELTVGEAAGVIDKDKAIRVLDTDLSVTAVEA
jgi:hypothetical protein